MLRIIAPEEASQIAVVTGSKEMNGDNLYSKRYEASRYFRYEERKYLKDKINELAMNIKNKNIRETCIEE
jgi:hypothetical protein